MNVFHVISSIDIGGAEQVAFNIAKSKSAKFCYHIVEVVKSDSAFSNQIKVDLENRGVRFYTSPIKNNKLALLLFWSWFWFPYLKYRPDILHSHTEVPDLALWIFRRVSWLFFWLRPKYVRTIHNTQLWNKWKWVSKFVEPFYQKNNCNVAISENTMNCYVECYGGDCPLIINNGVNEVCQEQFNGIDKQKINILFAGRFEYQKGIDIMLSVVKHFAGDTNFQFYIIGAGADKALIQRELKNQENVIIKEKIYGLNKYLGSFDYLFAPSRFEGLALLPIEASFAKTPSIISDCLGLKDTLPSDWPLKSKTNSTDDFIRIIEKLQKDGQRDKYGQTAYKFVKSKFSIEKMIRRYERFYLDIISGEK